MKLLAITAALALLASPVLAQNSVTAWSGEGYNVVGAAPGDDPGCIMFATYEIDGRSDVEFNLVWNGEKAFMALTSLDWSAERDKVYEGFFFYFPQSDAIYNGGVTTGYVQDYVRKGFLTGFEPDFLDRLASEDRLFVMRLSETDEEGTVVADLGLKGSGAAVAALRRCAAHVERREAARIERESRNDYIARDPFKS